MRVLISDLTKHLGVAPDAPETTIRAALAAPVVGDEDRIMASMYACLLYTSPSPRDS